MRKDPTANRIGMTWKQAELSAQKVTMPRFGLLLESGNGVWYYECKTKKHFGQDCHIWRFRGCLWTHFNGYGKHNKSVYSGGKWKPLHLALEIYRTDRKVSVVSEAVLDAILTK